ncbi:cation:proton antiporter [Nocardiopsis sp. CNT312]|uniref:cation:proton antiporter domain-containing protein n=1 Tax=Nocardiopsis sp. CNT312 TaxID=1137268 RepID=UPI0004921A96|nr:cation:proton antiporter [Nocardiopsis sp. CNT312]
MTWEKTSTQKGGLGGEREPGTVLAILSAAVAARWIALPGVVLDIALGSAIGPSGMGPVGETESVAALSGMGLALLMFMAGYGTDVARAARGTPRHTGTARALSPGVAAAWLVTGGLRGTLIIGLSLTTTALPLLVVPATTGTETAAPDSAHAAALTGAGYGLGPGLPPSRAGTGAPRPRTGR